MVPIRRGRGFTILEILIAVVVISVGLIGVLGLLGQSLKRSGKTVEEGFAMTLGRSIMAALRDGSRERAFMVDDPSTPKPIKGFVWLHIGLDTQDKNGPPSLPTSPSDTGSLTALRKSDYVVFLPGKPATGPEPIFVFPRPASDPTSENTSGADDWLAPAAAPPNGDLNVSRVFRIPPPDGLDTRTPADSSVQYGFAVSIQRAKTPNLVDASDNPITFANTTTFVMDTSVFPPLLPSDSSFQDGLYTIEVMIFRNFETSITAPSHKPIQRYRGLLALGP
jgi:prepilin-type N-terminal cleavage/methylation domain-containing protein